MIETKFIATSVLLHRGVFLKGQASDRYSRERLYIGKSCYDKIKISLNLPFRRFYRQKRVDTNSGHAYDESSNM